MTKKKTATPVKSEEDFWDMMPDVEDLEKIVKRELKKLEDWEKNGNIKKE